MAKFGTKNVLFGYFWARIWNKLLSYLKSASSKLSNGNISQKTETKTKIPKLGTKNVLFGYF